MTTTKHGGRELDSWEIREVCRECRFWKVGRRLAGDWCELPNETGGECRQRTPVVGEQPWPRTDATDWCGGWVPRNRRHDLGRAPPPAPESEGKK